MKRMYKKAEPMSLGAVITIIILVILLVFVALALSGSFGNLGDYNPFGGGSNIDAVVLGCNTACDGNFIDSWCKLREVKYGKNDNRNNKYSCNQLLNGDPNVNIKLAGIKPCDIQCPLI